MANTKDIHVMGRVPYDFVEHAGPSLSKFLMYCSSPTMGFKITYHNCKYIPAKNGGKLAVYDFVMSGIEAFRIEFLMDVVSDITKIPHALVETAMYKDLDNATEWINF